MCANYDWYALYVKSRHEFVTERELVRKGINTFLPSVKRLRHWKDRKKFVDFPLFPGYLFVYINAKPEEYLNVLRTSVAVHLVSTEIGCPVPVPTEDINSLKLLIASGQKMDIYPHLKEGTIGRIKKGPLNGAIVIIRNEVDQYVFMVSIDILGRSIGVKICADDIESD